MWETLVAKICEKKLRKIVRWRLQVIRQNQGPVHLMRTIMSAACQGAASQRISPACAHRASPLCARVLRAAADTGERLGRHDRLGNYARYYHRSTFFRLDCKLISSLKRITSRKQINPGLCLSQGCSRAAANKRSSDI